MTESALAMRLGPPAETLDEERTLVAAARTDPEAAGRLFDKYYARVFGYIYRSTLDRHVTEDLTSNVFLSAFRHLGLFRWRRVPFGAWLYRIATNEVRLHYRRQKRLAATGSEAVRLELASEVPTCRESPLRPASRRNIERACAARSWGNWQPAGPATPRNGGGK